VSIEHLAFSHPCRQIDTKVIERLIRDFEGEGCIKETNRIPAIIDDSTLYAALKKLASAESFKTVSNSAPPRLDLERDTNPIKLTIVLTIILLSQSSKSSNNHKHHEENIPHNKRHVSWILSIVVAAAIISATGVGANCCI
jgi:hypothetical protein